MATVGKERNSMNPDTTSRIALPIQSTPRHPAHGRLFSIEDAAEYLGLSVGTLRNWLSARRLPFVKIGRLTKLSQCALDDFITAHTIDATNADLM